MRECLEYGGIDIWNPSVYWGGSCHVFYRRERCIGLKSTEGGAKVATKMEA